MATYEYVCMACETPFEERRPMTAAVTTEVACPSCGSERVRRRFSLFATGGATTGASAGCACGGACACAGH
jgi:putative FmdB family regulatory protein